MGEKTQQQQAVGTGVGQASVPATSTSCKGTGGSAGGRKCAGGGWRHATQQQKHHHLAVLGSAIDYPWDLGPVNHLEPWCPSLKNRVDSNTSFGSVSQA